jgi:hypothetical protein
LLTRKKQIEYAIPAIIIEIGFEKSKNSTAQNKTIEFMTNEMINARTNFGNSIKWLDFDLKLKCLFKKNDRVKPKKYPRLLLIK